MTTNSEDYPAHLATIEDKIAQGKAEMIDLEMRLGKAGADGADCKALKRKITELEEDLKTADAIRNHIQRQIPHQEKAALIDSWREAERLGKEAHENLIVAQTELNLAKDRFVEAQTAYQRAKHDRDLATARAYNRHEKIVAHKTQHPHLYVEEVQS